MCFRKFPERFRNFFPDSNQISDDFVNAARRASLNDQMLLADCNERCEEAQSSFGSTRNSYVITGDAETFPILLAHGFVVWRWSCPRLPPAVVAHVELAVTLGAQGCMLAVRPLLLGAPLLGDAEVAVAACTPAAIYT